MYREAGDYEAAVQCFRQARQVDPRHANSMFNEGVVLLNDLEASGRSAPGLAEAFGDQP